MNADGAEFGDADALVSRLEDNSRECVFLLGSPLTAPEAPSGPGVPTVSQVVRMVLDRLGPAYKGAAALEAELAGNPTAAYQRAFGALAAYKGPDEVNALVRAAVLQARSPSHDPKELQRSRDLTHPCSREMVHPSAASAAPA